MPDRVRVMTPSRSFASVLLVVVMSMTACGSSAPTPSEGGTAVTTPAATTQGPDGPFDIGDDRSLSMRCEGEGSPTVVFEAGDNSNASQYDQVFFDIAAVTQVCAYNRAGIDPEQEAEGCRGLSDLTGDLERLLEAADVPGPYVLVAASGGGFIASGFAANHRDEVAGFVLIDVPGAIEEPSPHLREILRCDAATNIERRDYIGVEREAWADRSEIGDIPGTVISVDYGPRARGDERVNVKVQRGWLVLSPQAIQVVAHTGHDVANEDPKLVIDQILRVVKAARAQS